MCEVFRGARCGCRRRVAGHSSRRPDRHPDTKTAAKAWTPPRASDGHADLSGVWSHNSATPFERPKELEGRAFLTEEEVANLKANAAELFNGDTDAAFGDSVFLAALRKNDKFKSTDVTGNYNHFWLVDREFDNLHVAESADPPDGRLPALTENAKKRQAAAAERRKLHPYDGPEDIALGQRCISGSVPMLRRRVQQLLPDRPGTGVCRGQHGDAARHPDDSDRRPSPSRHQPPAMAWRSAWALGG